MSQIIFALLLAVTAQGASEWREVTVSSTGTRWLVRSGDISNETNMKPVVWVSLDHSADKTLAARSTKQRVSVDCSAASYQVLLRIAYNAAGAVIDSEVRMANPYSHEPIAPETVMEYVAKAICPAGKYDG